MFLTPSFYDKYWNFDNNKFIVLLKKSQKARKKARFHGYKQRKEIILFASVSRKELWQFINKLSIFINSWIDVKWALWMLSKQMKNPLLSRIIEKMKMNIDQWISISETMSAYPKVFDPLVIALISVWEKTWQLWKILAELDKSILENIELKSKVKWAMIYPAILLFLTVAMVVFMMIFIIPKITEAFTKTGATLPPLTLMVVAISDFLINDWPVFIVSISSAIVILKLIKKTNTWRIFFAYIYTRLPIFWYIVRQSNIVYFVKSFTILLDAWVLLLDAIKTSSKVVPNLLYKREIIRVKNEVEVWLTISKSLWLNTEYDANIYINKLFPEDFAYVVSTWEETWSLSNSLSRLWVNYNSDLKRYIWNLATMLEPVIIVIVWFLVGTIVIAIMLPFFEMWKVAKDL